jgi:hypothetical protein
LSESACSPGFKDVREHDEEANMMIVLSVVVFVSAFVSAVVVIALSVAPQWHRIARLAMGHVEQPPTPLTALVQAERRIAVRRWSAMSAPTSCLRAVA